MTIRPGCGEMVAQIGRAARPREVVKRGESADPERSLRESVRRANVTIRRLCTEHGLNRLWTLTFRPEMATHDRAVVAERVRRFAERLRAAGITRWIAVGELHPGGHGWHVHLVLGQYVPKSMLAELWSFGFVDGRRIRAKGDGREAARRAAHYVAKYVAKDAESGEGRMGDHRYWRAQKMPVQTISCEASTTELPIILAMWRGQSAVVWEWSSDELEDWTGPPTRAWRW